MFRRSEVSDDSFGILSLRVAPFIIAPAVSVGRTLYHNVGWMSAIVTVVLGAIVLYRIANLMVRLAADRQLGTLELIRNYFGSRGAVLCALIICGSCIGWSSWQIDFCAKYISDTAYFKSMAGDKVAVSQLSYSFLILYFLPVLFRNRFITAVNRLVTTTLLLSFGLTLLFVFRFELISLIPMHWQKVDLSGLAFFLHTWIVYTLSVPSLFNADSDIKQARNSVKIFYLFLLPLVCVLGIGQGIHWPDKELIDLRLTPQAWWQVTLMIYVVAGGFAVCQTNIIFGAEAIAKAFSLRSYTHVKVIMGFFTYIFLSQRMGNSFGPSEIFKIMTLTILVIIVVRSFMQPSTLLSSKENQDVNIQVLAGSTLVGLLTQTGYVSVTGVSSFDAGLTAFALSAYYSQARRRRLAHFIRGQT